MNPNDETQLGRLKSAMEWSRKKLQPFREERYECIREYTGFHYSQEERTAEKVPLNMIEIATNIYLSLLAAQNPRGLVTTSQRKLKAQARKLEAAVNRDIERLDLVDSLQTAVFDSMFSMGIMKLGLTADREIELDGQTHMLGRPFAENVDLDDWVHDMSARDIREAQFMGNRYRLPYDWVMQSGLYEPAALEELHPTDPTGHNEGGDVKIETLSKGQGSLQEEFRDHVELLDLWLPHDNLLITVPYDGNWRALRIVDWSGPDGGPFHILSYNKVPNNIMPLSPSSLWRDLHDIINMLWNKVARQAEAQKTVLGVRGDSTDDGQRVLRAGDNDAIRMDHPEGAKEFHFGGIDQTTLLFTMQAKQLFMYMSGNLDLLGGMGAATETVGQDQLLHQSAGRRVATMQAKVIQFTRKIIKSLAWYRWDEPLEELSLNIRIDGTSREIPVQWRPQDRKGRFIDHNFDIDPYSMQEQSPGQRLQMVMNVVRELMPLAPMMAQQGIQFDLRGLLDLIARYANMNELNDIIVSVAGPIGEEPGGNGQGGEPRQSPVTNRINTRVNRPGATVGGRDEAMMQLLAGGGLQRGQAAGMNRMAG